MECEPKDNSRIHRVSRKDIFNVSGIDKKKVLKECLRALTCNTCEKWNTAAVHKLAQTLFFKIRQKWMTSKRTTLRFLQKNKLWLNQNLEVVCKLCKSTGRPKSEFCDLTTSAKNKRTKDIRLKTNLEELTHATQSSLRASGNHTAALLLNKATSSSVPHTKTNKMLKAYEKFSMSHNFSVRKLTPDEALAMLVNLRLSKRQYQQIRMQAKEHRAELYPAYNDVRVAKRKCLPVEGLSVTSKKAEMSLQSLLNLTTHRLLESLKYPAEAILSTNLCLLSKWGCDGSSGQKQYKQEFQEAGDDTNLFLTCLVPIRLYFIDSTKRKILLWQNPTPSSTLYCRPLRMKMVKEDVEVTVAEKKHVEEEIAKLIPTLAFIEGNEVKVKHQLVMTMIDGKIINSLTNTSSQICYVCGSSPKEINDLEKVRQKPIDITTFTYGLSTLHSWIRFFEWLLHISYRLQLKKWQARKDDKEIVNLEKKRIQTEFKTKMGILVDQPKQGTGTTNDGNTARRFFSNPDTSSQITKIDKTLIHRCSVILQTISSGFSIKCNEFDQYAMDTAKLAISLYPWYYMPPAVHKVLVHGSEIIQHALVPIGQLSEEAQEARNKDYRRFREHNSRKCDRISTNTDVFNNLLLSSDPVLSSLRKTPRAKTKKFHPEAIALFDCPDQTFESSEAESDSDSE